ncbi:MAG: L,D-transpeptidase [Bauldia sp.]|nr:MAG: L,D-transpeptidase [Bauldia sp.]MBZ0229195.1 L,D-transpeptidase [Bauldia sp.]
MKKIIWVFVALCALTFAFPAAAASVVAKISLSQQRMTVTVNGVKKYSWAVSTARPGYRTPVGSFRPQAMKRMHYSSKYDNAPMPHSIFFLGGYAVHGTNAIRTLGRAVSHGCVRLAPGNAATLYSLVANNRGNTRIVVTR